MYVFLIFSIVIWLLIVFGFFVFVVGNDKNLGMVCWVVLIGVLFGFVVMILLIMGFDLSMVVL